MTIDSSFCFSLRSALSHGYMTEKTQAVVHETRYAAFLAFICAERFLRAQRLAGMLVNCYVPDASNLALVVQLAALPKTQDQTDSHALELLIDDPQVPIDGALFEEQKES